VSISEKYRSLLYSLSAVLFWSTIATAFKITLAGMNSFQLVFYASLASSIVLGIFAYNKTNNLGKILFSKYNLFKNLLMGFINPFVFYFVLIKAYDLLTAQEAMILNYSWPIVLSIFSVIFLKDKFSSKTILGLITAFVGVIIIATHGDFSSLSFHHLLGTSLALTSTLIWSAFWILNLKDKREDIVKLFGAFFFGTIYTAVYLLFFDSFLIDESIYILGAVYIGLFEMGITFVLWLKGLSLSQNRANTSTLVFLSPFLSLIFIMIILGEQLYLSSISGLFFIIAGIFIQQTGKKKSQLNIKV